MAEQQAVCPLCQDAGWIFIEKDGLSAAKRCSCASSVKQNAPEDLEARANIPLKFASASFDTFSLPADNPVAHKALTDVMLKVRRYCTDFPFHLKRPGLMLIGNPGCGKTHLAVAVLRRLIERGHRCLFVDYSKLIESIKKGFDPVEGGAHREAYREALEADVLLLDDLGAHRAQEYLEDALTAIFSHRSNNNLPTIVTTNEYDPDAGDVIRYKELETGHSRLRVTLEERIGIRARSRLFEMCTIINMRSLADFRTKNNRIL